jgi:hypothetical protein
MQANASRQSRKIELVCLQCGSPFLAYPSRVKNGAQFCSPRCYLAGPTRRRGRSGTAVCSLPERFWPKVDKTGECWLWMAGKTADGYGVIGAGGRAGRDLLAHRVAWELTNGPIPVDTWVLHNCPGGDNPSCVNPAHLYLGTRLENTRDAVSKGQIPQGERHWMAKITDAQALEIRSLHQAGWSLHALANHVHLSLPEIGYIVSGRGWRHLSR